MPAAVAVPAPAATPSRSVTAVRRDGAPLAVIVHDSALDAEPGPRRRGGRSGADDARERAPGGRSASASAPTCAPRAPGWLGPLTPGRREIERDLHDGAQQRLVALRMKLADAEAHAASRRRAQPIARRAGRRHGGHARGAAQPGPRRVPGPARRARPRLAPSTSVADSAPLPVRVDATALAGASRPRSRPRSTSAAWRRSRTPPSTPAPAQAVTVRVRAHAGRRRLRRCDDDGSRVRSSTAVAARRRSDEPPRPLSRRSAGDRSHVASSAGRGTTVSGDLPARA